MTPRYHMQDQVHDRIKDLMGENQTFTWAGSRLPNIAAPAIILLFLLLGLNW